MKLSEQHDVELERSEGIEQQSFTFDQESIGLMISAFLRYSNPIGALVRELVSNAYDANVEAKSKLPVTVALEISGTGYMLKVSDTGTGMSRQTLEEVYIKFGKSTKRDSNDYIGAYGLGSKSPLGYSEIFVCETIKDGIKNTLAVTKTGSIPKANFISEDFTDEPNGTTISVPINLNDYWKFDNEIKSQLRYFDNVVYTNAVIKNNNLLEEDKIVKAKNFVFNSSFNDFKVLHICMGKVYYPLRFDVIFDNSFSIKSNVREAIKNSNIGLYFDIGELDVVWNREDINYSEENLIKIRNKILLVVEELNKLITEEFSNININKLYVYSALKIIDNLFSNSNSSLVFGKAVVSMTSFIDYKESTSVIIKSIILSKLSVKHYTLHKKEPYSYSSSYIANITNNDKVLFSKPHYTKGNIRSFIKYNRYYNLYVLDFGNYDYSLIAMNPDEIEEKELKERYNKEINKIISVYRENSATYIESDDIIKEVKEIILEIDSIHGYIKEYISEKCNVIHNISVHEDEESNFTSINVRVIGKDKTASRQIYQSFVNGLIVNASSRYCKYIITTFDQQDIAEDLNSIYKKTNVRFNYVIYSVSNKTYRSLLALEIKNATLLTLEEGFKVIERNMARYLYNFSIANRVNNNYLRYANHYNSSEIVFSCFKGTSEFYKYLVDKVPQTTYTSNIKNIIEKYVQDIKPYTNITFKDADIKLKYLKHIDEEITYYFSSVNTSWISKLFHTQLHINLQTSYYKRYGHFKIFKD